MDLNNNENNCVQNSQGEINVTVQKIYDTCKDKDCLTDMRVYLSPADQTLIDNAINIRARKSELVWTTVNVEEVPFNRGFYGVDLMFYFKTGFEVYTGDCRPSIVEGLSFYNKKVILYGGEGNTTTFSSLDHLCKTNRNSYMNLPIAEVEIVDPIVLSTRIINASCNCCCSESENLNLPDRVSNLFCDGLIDAANRKLVVSLGLFSVVRTLRDVQVQIPCSPFTLPEKECSEPSEEEPCSFFEKLGFPTNEFFPHGNGCDC